MKKILDELLQLLTLERIEDNIFRGISHDLGGKSVYGGQVLGQALIAAGQTVEHRNAHSLHAYFLLPGDMRAPIVYQVERTRDGGSFSMRRVVAIQHGRPIFNMATSFQEPETGHEHQAPMPQVPPPEQLTSFVELRRQVAHKFPAAKRHLFTREMAIDIRPVAPVDFFQPEQREPQQQWWLKTISAMPDELVWHQAVLAYASDLGMISTSMLPHGLSFFDPHFQAASLDHAMWFHHPFRLDDWLLYATDSPCASGGRGLNRGSFFTRDGKLIASVTQEGLIRSRQARATQEGPASPG